MKITPLSYTIYAMRILVYLYKYRTKLVFNIFIPIVIIYKHLCNLFLVIHKTYKPNLMLQ